MAPALSLENPSSNLSLFTSKLSNKTITRRIPMLKITMLNQSWSSLSSEINTHILKSLPKTPPPAVAEPMHRLVSIAPPSVASALCLAACELVGGARDRAMNAACAIQLMHAGMHAHSQLLRHEHVMAPGIQLMTGDSILPFGYEMVARCAQEIEPERILRVIVEITKAAGANGAVEGQLVEAEGWAEEEWAWERKGGRLSACGAVCGAIVGGGSEEEIEKMRRFGWYVGMINEMITSSSTRGDSSGGYGKCREIVEAFMSLARLELQGFEEEKVKRTAGLFLGFGRQNRTSNGSSLSPALCAAGDDQ